LAWDADFRYNGKTWNYHHFVGTTWNNVNNDEKKLYIKNAYRVLLTRARQGMALFIPFGNDEDPTRKKAFYDETYTYLKRIGIKEI